MRERRGEGREKRNGGGCEADKELPPAEITAAREGRGRIEIER